jgi:hypothetical protein
MFTPFSFFIVVLLGKLVKLEAKHMPLGQNMTNSSMMGVKCFVGKHVGKGMMVQTF